VACDALSYILDMLYTETLREDEGGTYGASSATEVSNKPDERHMMQVVFQTNVESADKLRELAKSGFRGIAENGPTADQFDKTVKNLQKTIPENRQKNAYWSSILLQNARYGYDYDKDYEAAVNALTPEKVKAAAQEFLNGNFIELVMRPE
jgi:zinc protease